MKGNEMPIRLGAIAAARSGDKGNHANIGVVARDANAYRLICTQLTTEAVAEWFRGLGCTAVRRYELPNLLALNFILENALGGGASRSLRLDSQGKALGTALLDMPIRTVEEDV